MKKIDRMASIAVILIVISMAGYIYLLHQQMKRQHVQIGDLELKYDGMKKEIIDNSDKTSSCIKVVEKLEQYYSSMKKSDEEPLYMAHKSRIRSLLEKNINDIVSEKPLQNGKWFVSNVRFISPTVALVEYEDGHVLITTLIQILKTDTGYSLIELQ